MVEVAMLISNRGWNSDQYEKDEWSPASKPTNLRWVVARFMELGKHEKRFTIIHDFME